MLVQLPQYDQKLELYPADMYALAETLQNWLVHVASWAAQHREPLSRADYMSLKPAGRLSARLLRLADSRQHQARKLARLKFSYDELLLLQHVVSWVGLPDYLLTPGRLVGEIDLKSLSLEPFFSRSQ